MKKAILLLTIVVLVFACSSSGEKDKKDSATSCKRSLNPNGDSQLALLMREMATWTDSCKSAVMMKKENPAEPTELINIHTLQKTDSTIDIKLFNACADVYLQKVRSFKALGIDLDSRADAYNEMVHACVSCHENFCGGPIKRIQKLMLPKL